MSKKKKIEVYSLADFNKATRLDRIRMHMIEPERFQLDYDDQDYYEGMQKAYHMVFDNMRESQAVKMIQNEITGFETWYKAKRLLSDVQLLFGEFVEKNRDLRRAILVEKLYRMAEKAEQRAIFTDIDENGIETEYADKEWIELAAKLYTDAAKIEGLDQHQVPMVNPDEIVIPAIEITSDPQAFLEAQLEEAEEGHDDED